MLSSPFPETPVCWLGGGKGRWEGGSKLFLSVEGFSVVLEVGVEF